MSPPADAAAERLRARALELGFDGFGIARAEELPEELAQLRRWTAEGRQGDLHWLADRPEVRANPSLAWPDCRSVVVLTLEYLREPLPPPGSSAVLHGPEGPMGRISRYARTRDYHRAFEKMLRKMARFLDRELCPGARTKPYADAGPVMERPWAVRAGLGFVGKHTLVIDPARGSTFFLGVLLTTAELPPTPVASPMPGCGDCRRCIDACPTGAITEPWRLDARRCLSYLTVEKGGEVDPEFWDQFRGFVFGCDICQDVCPYNQRRAQPREQSPLGAALLPESVALVELLQSPEGFLERLGESSSPLKRTGPERLLRSALIVASERGDAACAAAMEEVAKDPGRPDWLRATARRARERWQARRTAR